MTDSLNYHIGELNNMKLKTPFRMKIETDIEFYRHETFWTKEPETLAWIQSFSPGDLFVDVGANIGVYALYAASRGIDVIAIEPARKNFLRLCENVILNGFENVTLLNAVAGMKPKMVNFHVKENEIGASGGQALFAKDENGKSFEPICSYVLPCIKLDSLLHFGSVFHVKIDVDGQEEEVLKGIGIPSITTYVKSALVEVNKRRDFIVDIFKASGLTDDNDFNKMENHSRVRRAAEGIIAENIIFTRK